MKSTKETLHNSFLLISKLCIEHTDGFFCFPLSKSLISMLYIEDTNEKIEPTNELQAAD